jgi:Virulence factor BrkB/PAS domain
MPLKRDLDPTEIPPRLLPHLQLIDVVGDGARFRYRLIGTSLVDTYGKDYTGSYVDELVSGDRLTFIDQTYRTVCQLKAPVFSHNHYRTIRDTDLIANRMYLPLTNDGIEVHYILGALQFEYADSIHGGVWGLATLEWRDVWVGAAITAVLFTLGKSLIGWYIGSSAVASSYGAAGALIIVLLRVYYSSEIFLLGAEFTRAYSLQHGSHRDGPLPKDEADTTKA